MENSKMKVIETYRSEAAQENCDYRNALEIKINGKVVFYVSDGEPEDATISRDFSDCHSVVNLMRQSYEAGKNGEEFEVEGIESDEI